MDTDTDLRMGKEQPSDATTRKRVKQPISIPFIWEEFPGIPKKNWTPTPPPPSKKPEPPPPAKYIASVPFKWEEKPGTPLLSLPPARGNVSSLPQPLPLPPSHENVWSWFNDKEETDEIDLQYSYPETCESETDDSLTSAPPSLLANALVPTTAISNAVAVQQLLQSPASPASESDTTSICSYETGPTTSLAGTNFLEWLFPLLAPQSKSLEKDDRPENSVSRLQTRKHASEFLWEKNRASIVQQQTLGELIQMSRRFSYQRKAVQRQMEINLLPKKFGERNGLRSCFLETTEVLGRLQKKWMRQIQLKLM